MHSSRCAAIVPDNATPLSGTNTCLRTAASPVLYSEGRGNVPIPYYGRIDEEGKKITWKDGFAAVGALLRCRFWA